MKAKKILSDFLNKIDENYGGDITFIPVSSKSNFDKTSEELNYKFPNIFSHFYLCETNGLIIDNKRIYSIYDTEQKKTWVENVTRMNNPKTSPWFKFFPQAFEKYIVIGEDDGICFCLSKIYDYENPNIYMCESPNSKTNLDFKVIPLDLKGLIHQMIVNTFE